MYEFKDINIYVIYATYMYFSCCSARIGLQRMNYGNENIYFHNNNDKQIKIN